MKILVTLFLTAVVLYSGNAQNYNKEVIEVKTITLKKGLKLGDGKHDLSQYFFANNGQISANKGYKIVYAEKNRSFYVTNAKGKLTNDNLDNPKAQNGHQDLGGGYSISCQGCKEATDCVPYVYQPLNGPVSAKCDRVCAGCMTTVRIPSKVAANYQTPNGNSNEINQDNYGDF